MDNTKVTKPRICQHCGTEMLPCDYSPIYGHSWYHPESFASSYKCPYSGHVLFGGFDDSDKQEFGE